MFYADVLCCIVHCGSLSLPLLLVATSPSRTVTYVAISCSFSLTRLHLPCRLGHAQHLLLVLACEGAIITFVCVLSKFSLLRSESSHDKRKKTFVQEGLPVNDRGKLPHELSRSYTRARIGKQ